MVVTLEVSKLSGWLKVAALCRVQRAHPIREDTHGTEMAQKGKSESAAHAACKAQAEAHPEHVAHVCDAGGVEAQRLVERQGLIPRALPRVAMRAYDIRGEVRAGRREMAGDSAESKGGTR
eukprot:scaffold62501_cov69-Phaeocystis_antarctica.AAC.3